MLLCCTDHEVVPQASSSARAIARHEWLLSLPMPVYILHQLRAALLGTSVCRCSDQLLCMRGSPLAAISFPVLLPPSTLKPWCRAAQQGTATARTRALMGWQQSWQSCLGTAACQVRRWLSLQVLMAGRTTTT